MKVPRLVDYFDLRKIIEIYRKILKESECGGKGK